MDYLLEIGTEELPAGSIDNLCQQLADLFRQKLLNSSVSGFEIETYSTPRRLAVLCSNLPAETDATTSTILGPGKDAPAKAIEGFCRKHEISKENLKEYDKRLGFQQKISPKSISTIIQQIVCEISDQLTGSKWMSWGEGEYNFSRPVRWICSLLDNEVLEFEAFGLKAGRHSQANRLLNSEEIEISEAKDYEEVLRKNLVEVSQESRREMILEQIAQIQAQQNLQVQISEDLLGEILDLTEYPVVLLGSFEEEFLKLPDFTVITVLEKHQRYFPCFSADGRLSREFVIVANCLTQAKAKVIAGNERVVRARLRDLQFFVEEDLKSSAEAAREKLSGMTFQRELGSMLQKNDRLESVGNKFADLLKLSDKELLHRAIHLMKIDLGSNLVFEFPELQGKVSSLMAKHMKENEIVCQALHDQYLPEGLASELPQGKIASLLSILEKMDNVICLFAIGKIPTGSADPYALRRQSQGIIEILLSEEIEQEISLYQLGELFYEHIDLENKEEFGDFFYQTSDKKIALKDFLKQRLIYVLEQKGHEGDLVRGFYQNFDFSQDPRQILNQLQAFKDSPDRSNLLRSCRAIRRLVRIIKDKDIYSFDPEILKSQLELDLYTSWQSWERSQEKGWASLTELSENIENLFEGLLVEDPGDQISSNNRKGLLQGISNSIKESFGDLDWDAVAKWLES